MIVSMSLIEMSQGHFLCQYKSWIVYGSMSRWASEQVLLQKIYLAQDSISADTATAN